MSLTGDMRLSRRLILIFCLVLPASSLPSLTANFSFHESIRGCNEKSCIGALDAAAVSEPSANCRCDGNCAEYRDCCYDSPAFNLQEEPQPRYECVDLLDRAFYMKTECPAHLRNSKLARECKDPPMADPYLTLPVTNNKTLITYRNSFCAKCNNVKDFFVWEVQLYYLNDESDYTEIEEEWARNSLHFNKSLNSWGYQIGTNFVKIHMAPSPPESMKPLIRQCKANVISTCSNEWRNPETKKLCASYNYLVYDSKNSYKNPHCAECNYVPLKNLSCQDTSQRDGFDLNNVCTLFQIFSIYERTPTCKQGAYDIFEKKCRNVDDILYPIQSSSLINCSKTIIKSGNYKYGDNSEINIPLYDKSFTLADEYITDNGDLLICTEILGLNYESDLSIGELGNKIISLIGYILSIILLLVHLIVFFVNPTHNLSKYCIASLSGSLLIAYTSLLIGNSFSGIQCNITSVVSLYSLLASFLWMFTISYDCWRLVRSADKCLIEQNENQRTRFALYSTFSWTLPALIVCTTIVFDQSNLVPTDWKPFFGVHSCWFGKKKPLLAFFVLPFIILTILNTFLFSHSAYIIYRIKKGMNSTHCKKKFKIYLNLALTMGMTWTVGLIAMTFDRTPFIRQILWLVFTFLNAFQGVFIFITFTCNRKVINKLKFALKKNISVMSKTSNSSSRTNEI